jgi:hypothetical protein
MVGQILSNELERNLEGSCHGLMKVLSQHLPERMEGNHIPSTYRIQVQDITTATTTTTTTTTTCL